MDTGRPGKTVLVAGTFDFLHPGHLHLFSQAKKRGSRLVVVVARDETVRRIKGRRPYFSQAERALLVGSLSVVDRAVVGNSGDLFKVIGELAPNVIVLGYDQWPDEAQLKRRLAAMGLRIKVVRAKEKDPKRFKSSLIRKYLSIEK